MPSNPLGAKRLDHDGLTAAAAAQSAIRIRQSNKNPQSAIVRQAHDGVRNPQWPIRLCLAILLIALVPLGLGCPGMVNMPAPPTGSAISLANDVQPIFSARCTSCHSPGFPTNSIVGIDMVLTSGRSFASLINQPSSQRPDLTLVVPGNSAQSLLWLKVSSNNPPVGATMPLLGQRLPSNELATIRDWIDQGAMNN